MQVGSAQIAILSRYLTLVPAVSAATSQVLSTESPVEHGQRTASCDTSLVVSGGVDCERRRRNVYDKKPRRYAKDNRTTHLTARSDKSVAYVTNNKRLYSTFCTVEANYWQTQSIARPLCDSWATCDVIWRKTTGLRRWSTSCCSLVFSLYLLPNIQFINAVVYL